MGKNYVHTISGSDHDKTLERIFADLFRQHEQRLYNLTYRLTKSELYAKDVIQEVFLKLWEHRDEIPSIQNMEAWLYRLTENKLIDFLRKAAADERLKQAILTNLQERAPETESLITAKEYHVIIQKAIDELPPQRKLIYYMNREQGMNYKEIATRLNLSRHTVKNQLSTALQSIKKFLMRNVKIFLALF